MLALILLWSFTEAAWGKDCRKTDYDLRSLEETALLYNEGCDRVRGNISVDVDVEHLRYLRNLRYIGGNLQVYADHTNMDGLWDLQEIGGDLTIKAYRLCNGYGCIHPDPASGSNLFEFQALRTIGGDLNLTPDVVTSTTGAFRLEKVGGAIRIGGKTEEYRGGSDFELLLDSVEEIGALYMEVDAPGESSIDLPKLRRINGDVEITPAYFSGVPQFTSLDLGYVEVIPGDLKITGISRLDTLRGLRRLSAVHGNVTIKDNADLSNCSAIAPLLGWPSGPPNDRVGGSIVIADNDASYETACMDISDVLYFYEPPTCETYGLRGAYVQKIFIAYLGRPAAPAGLRYYVSQVGGVTSWGEFFQEGGKRVLFDDLYYSAEAKALYNTMTLAEQINQFYQFMFNRDALSGGLNYWIGQINGGYFTIPASAAQIADAASDEGRAKLDAKQVAANKLMCAIGDDAAKLSAFQANAAGARASIAAVTTAEQAGAYDGEAELAKITGSAKAMAVKRPDSARQGSVSERPSGDAEPIPAIPALGFLILSCFATLLGLRRLADR